MPVAYAESSPAPPASFPFTPPHRWAVVGGGMLGLVAAWRLAQAGQSVTVFEAATEPGGLAAAWRIGDVQWDRHYHVILSSDTALTGLLDELGLGAELRWTTTRTGFFVQDRLHEFSGARDYLRLPTLGWIGKARLGATIARGALIRDGAPLEQLTSVEWLTRWSGAEVVENFWLPLLRAKLGSFAEQASAAFIWASIARLFTARKSGVGPERFGYVRGGYAAVLARLTAALEAKGVEIRLGSPVSRVQPGPDGLEIHVPGRAVETFDEVVVTAAPPLAARLCPSLTREEKQRLEGVPYLGILCTSLLLRRPLSGHYVTNLADARIPFTGLIEMTAVVDPAELGGRTLVYVPRYAPADDPAWNWSDAELEAKAVAAVRTVHPAVTDEDVLACRISRVRQVMALPALDFTRRHLPARATSVPGLHLVNSAQIVNSTLNVNATILIAEQAVSALLADRAARKGAA
jgi:protoporphyrinogen oxidase